LASMRSTCLIAYLVFSPRASARPCPIKATCQRGGFDRPQRGSSQGEDALCVQILAEHAFQEALDALERDLLVS
jgi:hypothetical protein